MMNNIGEIRYFDELGRIHIPTNVRKAVNLEQEAAMIIRPMNDGSIVLTPVKPRLYMMFHVRATLEFRGETIMSKEQLVVNNQETAELVFKMMREDVVGRLVMGLCQKNDPDDYSGEVVMWFTFAHEDGSINMEEFARQEYLKKATIEELLQEAKQ